MTGMATAATAIRCGSVENGPEVLMFIRSLVLILAASFAGVAFADQPQTIRVIPKSYVSPGASGSVSGSSSYQQHNLYGGQRLPQGSVRQESSFVGCFYCGC